MNAIHIFEIYSTMSLQMTHYAMGTGAKWPNVLFPEFVLMAELARNQTGADFFSYGPLVKVEERQDYEDFVFQNQGWIQTALNRNTSLDQNISMPPYMFAFGETTGEPIRESKQELYAPVTQISPLDSYGYLMNYNAFDFLFFRRVFDGMVEANRAVLSEVNNMEAWSAEVNYTDEYVIARPEAWPRSFMASPMYNRLGEGAELVGTVTALLPWHSFFQNVIPEGINGIVIVVRNTCDQEFSYRIDGPEVSYLGPKDHHDPNYDEYEVEASFTAFTSIADCIFSFNVYPTEEIIDAYETNRPLTFTFAIVAVFVGVTLVFMVYDMLVERRQEKVMSSAMRSGAIVNR
jgi:hypothetical protein